MNLIVVLIELEIVKIQGVVCNGDFNLKQSMAWNPKNILVDRSGVRLGEEIGRRIVKFKEENKAFSDSNILVSMPGTLLNNKTVKTSSRIGILHEVSIAKIIEDQTGSECFLFHDTECLSKGEILYGTHYEGDEIPSSVIYFLIDEGVGAKIYINNKCFKGTGTAGLMARLIVQKDGIYNENFRSTGLLESYISRPAISDRVIQVFHSELGKDNKNPISFDLSSKFRQAIQTVAADKMEWSSLDYSVISNGVKKNDPIAVRVVNDAAEKFGYSLHTLITIISPELLILAGRMISDVPTFAEKAIDFARQYSWPTVWNTTKISLSKNDREMQIYGAIEMFKEQFA